MPARREDGDHLPAFSGAVTERLSLDPIAESARQSRHFVRRILTDVSPPAMDDVLLVATELVTNAVLHGKGPIELTLAREEDEVLVSVFDCEPVHPEQRPHDAERTSGRGLALVALLSRAWGTTPQDGGKTVWAVMTATSALALEG